MTIINTGDLRLVNQVFVYRIYSEDFGRFLSPDPLFEQFDSWTPYHFGFNNPVTYSDPSGLAPKKEKREAKLLVWVNK